MRDYASIFDLRPSLIGTLSTISGTAVGAPIDVLGFADVLGVLTLGGIQGSTGSTVTLAVKIQQSASATGTGSNWSDVTNDGVTGGSFAFSSVTVGDNVAGGTTTGTWIPYESVKKYAKLSTGGQKRYIRMHATLTGTVGLGPKISAGFLLGRPNDSSYVTSAIVVPSGNVELTKLL